MKTLTLSALMVAALFSFSAPSRAASAMECMDSFEDRSEVCQAQYGACIKDCNFWSSKCYAPCKNAKLACRLRSHEKLEACMDGGAR